MLIVYLDGDGMRIWNMLADTYAQEKNKAIEHHFFRSERQSLRRYVHFTFWFFHGWGRLVWGRGWDLRKGSYAGFKIAAFLISSRSYATTLMPTSLPRTGAIVFTIRTYFHPITEICKEPYVPGRLASAVRSWGDDVSRYKGRERYGDVLLEYLDRMHEEQVRGGLDVSKEEEERAYPF
jgi:hypothetical protein